MGALRNHGGRLEIIREPAAEPTVEILLVSGGVTINAFRTAVVHVARGMKEL